MTTAGLQDIGVDIDVAGPQDYVDNAGPSLLAEGWYNLELKEFTVNRDAVTGEFLGSITLNRLRVIDGEAEGRFVNDLRVWATVFERNGVKVSGLGDFIRGIDKNASWSGVAGAEDQLQRAVDQNLPIRIKLQWEAFDSKGFEQEGGKRMAKKSAEQKALRKQATVKGMRNFPQYPDGTYRDNTTGPISGETINARLVIDRVEPSRN